MAAADSTKQQTTTLADWAGLGIHRVTLPSGAKVRILIPDLTVLIANDAVPETLRTAALEQINEAFKQQAAAIRSRSGEPYDYMPPEMTKERLSGLAELNAFLVSVMLVEPELSVDDLRPDAKGRSKVPPEDVLMLSQFASRERDTDARGVVLGIEPLDRYEEWRSAHGCPDECTHCAEAIAALSSIPG